MKDCDKSVGVERHILLQIDDSPSGDSNEISRLARVSKTIGRFSSRRSSAGDGRNPTYVSVFETISTYDAVWQSDAAEQYQQEFMNHLERRLT